MYQRIRDQIVAGFILIQAGLIHVLVIGGRGQVSKIYPKDGKNGKFNNKKGNNKMRLNNVGEIQMSKPILKKSDIPGFYILNGTITVMAIGDTNITTGDIDIPANECFHEIDCNLLNCSISLIKCCSLGAETIYNIRKDV
jgi:hypothetical protein